MIHIQIKKYYLQFKYSISTSQGIILNKKSYLIYLTKGNHFGLGESSVLTGLSPDDVPNYEKKLLWISKNINKNKNVLFKKIINYPSIYFGFEQAFLSLKKNSSILFPSDFTKGKIGIKINNLISTNTIKSIKNQFYQQVSQGVSSIKIKIGINSFEKEYKLLKKFRYTHPDIEIRVDANGAFLFKDALKKLEYLSDIGIHSIEQPIHPGQWKSMAKLCKKSSLPIALDEELISIYNLEQKKTLLNVISPQYLVLKPSFCGGFQGVKNWIVEAKKRGINWWITSALESNIALNAIAQWTYCLKNTLSHGLNTGGLYKNNFLSPLFIKNNLLWYNPNKTLKY